MLTRTQGVTNQTMELQYPFSEYVRSWFLDGQYCWLCGRNANAGLELHHVFGRVSNSAYNAAVLCLECHKHVTHNLDERIGLVITTQQFLKKQGYYPSSTMRKEDLRFCDLVEASLPKRSVDK